MAFYNFDTGTRLEVVHHGPHQIDKKHIVLIAVKDMEIDVEHFGSADLPFSKREGFLQLALAGQTTLFPYAGTKKVAAKFLNKAVYLGKNPGAFSLRVSLTEVDEDWRQRLGTVSKWTDILSASPLAAFHPAVGPGLGLLGGLLNSVRSNIKDDEEAQALLLHELPLKDGDILALNIVRADKRLATVKMAVKDLGAIQHFSRLSVRVGTPALSLPDGDTLRGLIFSRLRFNFEASSGTARYVYSTDLGKIPAALTWRTNELFVLDAAEDEGNRHLVPLFLSVSLNPREFKAEELAGVLEQSLRLGSALGADTEDLAAKVTKQAPTVLNTLSEFLSNSLAVYSFNGAVLLDPPGGGTGTPSDALLVLPWHEEQKVWRTQISAPLRWLDEAVGGHFAFDLEVKPVP